MRRVVFQASPEFENALRAHIRERGITLNRFLEELIATRVPSSANLPR